MTDNKEMDTLLMVLNHLKTKNQDHLLELDQQGRVTLEGKLYDPKELTLIQTYRFEGASDPSEEAIIYLIRTNDGTIGYSLDAYGVYTNHEDDGYAGLIHGIVTAPVGSMQMHGQTGNYFSSTTVDDQPF
jgi:hypothetical protein